MERVLNVLIDQWEYDITVMSQPWMYWLFLVPITFYLCFFCVKWTILTVPMWLPIALILKAFRK